MKEELRALIGLINKTSITHRKSFLKMSQVYGLYVGQPGLLSYVQKNPGCTQTEIAEHLGVSSASIAFSTKRLEKAGFLMKQIDSLNMRCNKLYVTSEGNEVMERFREGFDQLNSVMFAGFTKEELEQVASFTQRIQDNLEKDLEKADSGENR